MENKQDQAQDQETTLGALDASLQELTKAAARLTGQPLVKADGVQIENSGTQGSDGKQGGGQGSMSDAGSVEDLMIGKMTDLGLNARQASGMLGFLKEQMGSSALQGGKFFSHDRPSPSGGKGGEMSGKAKPPMPPFTGKGAPPFGGGEDPGEPEDREPGEGGEGGEEPAEKSFREHFRASQEIADAVDVSPYLEEYTAKTVTALDSITGAMRKSEKRTEGHLALLMKSSIAQSQVIRAQQNIIAELGRRLGVVERQPESKPKGATSIPMAKSARDQALQKGMPGEQGAGGNDLKKSEVAAVLSYMHLEKGLKEIGGRKMSAIVAEVESAHPASLPADAVQAAQNFIQRYPGEAPIAKSYA